MKLKKVGMKLKEYRTLRSNRMKLNKILIGTYRLKIK